MANYSIDTATGVITPDTSSLRDDVVAEWQAALGNNIVTTPDTPQGVMITAEALAREAVANNNAQLANQINPNIAGGVFLDAICALLGLERRAASSSVINQALLTGQPATLVPAGSQARSEDGNYWLLQANVQLDVFGRAYGIFSCAEVGPILCTPGQMSEVVDMVLGWESVTNISAAIPGLLEESDAELAERRRVTLARQTISTREAQLSGIMDIEGVTSAVFRENVANASAVVDGVTMVAHSVWACVDGGSDFDIAMSLLKNKTDGADWNGALSLPTVDPYSMQVYIVKFDRPTKLYPQVSVSVRQRDDQLNPLTQVPKAVVAWANGKMDGDPGLTIGTMVSPYEIAGAVNRQNPGYFVTNVLVSLAGVDYPGGLPVTLKQRAVITESAVTVVVV